MSRPPDLNSACEINESMNSSLPSPYFASHDDNSKKYSEIKSNITTKSKK